MKKLLLMLAICQGGLLNAATQTQLKADSNGTLNLENQAIRDFEWVVHVSNPGKVKSLKLGHNNLKHIPAQAFRVFNNLWVLELGHNQIETVQPGAFANLAQLEYLNLNNNKLVKLKEPVVCSSQTKGIPKPALCFKSIFQEPAKLKKLDLSGNQLQTIEPHTFKDLVNLTMLNLNNNPLTSIKPNAFAGLGKLSELLISNKDITTFEPGTFNGVSEKLLNLYLEKNIDDINQFQRIHFPNNEWITIE